MKSYYLKKIAAVLCQDPFFLYLSRDEDAPAKVPDPDAVKPDGWLDDEPEFVSDPTAEKPDDWWEIKSFF